MKKQKGFSLIELLIVVAIILIIAAIAIPNLMRSKMAANEASAVGSVRTINTAMVTYSSIWGIGYATQDTLLKALIASVLPSGRRNLAFGLFYLGYGAVWLFGSVTTGLLYEYSRGWLVVFAVAVQLASIPFFCLAAKASPNGRTAGAPSAPEDAR